MNKPNITRQRKPMPIGQTRGPLYIPPQAVNLLNPDPLNPRPPKSKKHKRR